MVRRVIFPYRIVFAIVLPLAATLTVADELMPSSLIRIPESVATVFIAETSTATFHRFDRDADGLVHSDSFYMSIGQRGAGKNTSGDKRTPLGVYFVTEQLDTSKLHEKYGITAFPLDYPNAWDQKAGRSGDGIWVHGVHPEEGLRPALDTDGCIALPNNDLSALIPTFKDNVTPVVVTEEVQWIPAHRRTDVGDEIQKRIEAWVTSRVEGDTIAYLSLYDDDFTRWGMDKAEWTVLAMDATPLSAESADVEDVFLVGYPQEEGLYMSRFLLTLTRDSTSTSVLTRLYWRRDSGGTLKIVAENVG